MNSNSSHHHLSLIDRFKAGDHDAFTRIYDDTYFTIYQYAKRWLVDGQDAQDVTADTFIKLLHRRAQFVNMDNITAFLKVTVRNACLDFLKHKKVQSDKERQLIYELSQEHEPDFSWVEVQEAYLSLIYIEVEKLPAKMKEIFLLSYRDGLKPAQIAERLNITVRTVSNQKTNAIRLLREALQQHPLLLAFLLSLETGAIRL